MDDPRCWNDLAEENARLREENERLRGALRGIRPHAEQEILDWCADRQEGGGSPCYEVRRWEAVIAAIGETHGQKPFDHTGARR